MSDLVGLGLAPCSEQERSPCRPRCARTTRRFTPSSPVGQPSRWPAGPPEISSRCSAWIVSRQAMHRLLATLKSTGLVQGDGGGRHERFTLTNNGTQRLLGASTAVAAVQAQMLASFAPEQQRRLYADLAACADSLSRQSPPPSRAQASS